MKKFRHIFAGLSVATLFFSCTETDDGIAPSRAISFSADGGCAWPGAPAGSRAATSATSPEVFGPGDAIGVFACFSDAPTASFTSNFMHNQPVSFDGSVWSYSPVKYWPVNGSVEFRAYFPYSKTYDKSDDGMLTITHECKTALEPLYAAQCTVNADNGSLSGDGVGDNGNLSLSFTPLLNKVNFTANADPDLFDEVESDQYKDCRFLIKEFRVWGFYRQGKYTMSTDKWGSYRNMFTRETPLDLLLDLEDIETVVPGYKFDESAGYCTKEAVVLKEGEQQKNILGKSAYFIPMNGVVSSNEPGFEVVYVVLTNTADETDYKESGIVTRSGSLREIFAGHTGLIKKTIHINLEFSVDGVTVTRDLEDYIYKPMF
ncbi:MAG: fimbrillin family protein [Staphylococcus sp.]|nr:fimbrillin family protein [Staphylococcus sp.]